MKPKSNRWIVILWLLFALVTLVLYPLYSHLHWLRTSMPLHGVPAFFLGAVVFLVLGTGIALVVGGARKGLPWFISGPCLRLAVGSTALTVSVVFLFYSIELWRGRWAWARMAAEANRQGESLDPKTLLSPDVPAENNFAQAPFFIWLGRISPAHPAAADPHPEGAPEVLPIVQPWAALSFAAQSEVRLAPWLEAQSTDLIAWNGLCQKFGHANPATASTDPRVLSTTILKMLAPLDSLVEELRSYSDRPYCRLPGRNGLSLFTDPVAEKMLMAFLRILRVRASAELALGQDDRAFQDLQLLLRLAEFLGQQPCLMFHGAWAWAWADGVQPLWEALQGHRWSAAQCDTIQRRLQSLHPLADMPRHQRHLAFANAGFWEEIIPTTTPPREHSATLGGDAQAELRWLRRVYPRGWSLQNQAAIYQLWLDRNAAGPAPADHIAWPGAERSFAVRLMRSSSDPFFPIFLVPRMVQMQMDLQEYLPFTQTVIHLAAVACALQRYQIAHGVYPENLDALVPTFISPLPPDDMSHEPMRYRCREGKSYVLYSVGLDRQDNQGNPSPPLYNGLGEPEATYNLHQNDWVWRMPR